MRRRSYELAEYRCEPEVSADVVRGFSRRCGSFAVVPDRSDHARGIHSFRVLRNSSVGGRFLVADFLVFSILYVVLVTPPPGATTLGIIFSRPLAVLNLSIPAYGSVYRARNHFPAGGCIAPVSATSVERWSELTRRRRTSLSPCSGCLSVWEPSALRSWPARGPSAGIDAPDDWMPSITRFTWTFECLKLRSRAKRLPVAFR